MNDIQPFNYQRFTKLLLGTYTIGILIFILGISAFKNADSMIVFAIIGIVLNLIGIYSGYVQYQKQQAKLYLLLTIIGIIVVISIIILCYITLN